MKWNILSISIKHLLKISTGPDGPWPFSTLWGPGLRWGQGCTTSCLYLLVQISFSWVFLSTQAQQHSGAWCHWSSHHFWLHDPFIRGNFTKLPHPNPACCKECRGFSSSLALRSIATATFDLLFLCSQDRCVPFSGQQSLPYSTALETQVSQILPRVVRDRVLQDWQHLPEFTQHGVSLKRN